MLVRHIFWQLPVMMRQSGYGRGGRDLMPGSRLAAWQQATQPCVSPSPQTVRCWQQVSNLCNGYELMNVQLSVMKFCSNLALDT